MVPTRWLGGWGGAGGRWSSRSLLPPASPASCAAKDKALVSMWAPLKDPISRRQTLPLFQTPLWGTGGVPWVWNLTWCLSKPAFLLGWVLATPMKEESRVPGWEAAAEQSHGGGGSTTPKSSPPPDVCMCSVCDLDGDPATPVCGHVSSRLALFW